MKTILQAIATMEGFYKVGTRPNRNNNPGDLIWGDQARSYGATHADGRYAVFASVVDGWRGMQRWLSVPAKFSEESPGDGRPKGPAGYLVGGYLGSTIEQFLWRFAPPADGNNASSYLAFVTAETGCSAQDILTVELLQTPEVP